MASDMSTYLGNALCRWLAGNTMPAAPAACYVGLFDGNPKAGGTEVTATVRVAGRLPITFDAISVGIDNDVVNSADVDFGAAAGAVANLDYVGVFDGAAESGPALLFSKLLPGGPYAIAAGGSVKFLAGDLTFTIGAAT